MYICHMSAKTSPVAVTLKTALYDVGRSWTFLSLLGNKKSPSLTSFACSIFFFKKSVLKKHSVPEISLL